MRGYLRFQTALAPCSRPPAAVLGRMPWITTTLPLPPIALAMDSPISWPLWNSFRPTNPFMPGYTLFTYFDGPTFTAKATVQIPLLLACLIEGTTPSELAGWMTIAFAPLAIAFWMLATSLDGENSDCVLSTLTPS